jgi:ATP-dependent exoDNAse (exonuclease V) beta subunit
MATMRQILNAKQRQKFATDAGTLTHDKLRRIVIGGQGGDRGDATLIQKIKDAGLAHFFAPDAKTEVPIAGRVNGKFISRRIDRMVEIDGATLIMDYKTDNDKLARRENYIAQIREYLTLAHAAMPDRTIRGFILWTHDFTLEEIK